MADEFTIDAPSGTLAYARIPARRRSDGVIIGTERCESHGKMDRIDDPGAVTLERNGVVWEVDPDTTYRDGEGCEIHYCRECIDAELRSHDRRDAADLDLLREAISREWTNPHRPGTMNRTLFSVATVTDDATAQFCPYCSGDLEDGEDGALRCDIHGRMTIAVETAPEVPAP